MTDADTADPGSPGIARRSWPRRIGLALLAILWTAWLAVGFVVELAGSLAIGDHSGNSTGYLVVTAVWLGGLVVIGVIIAFVSRPPPR
jgi:hypothetical protein